MKTFHIHIMGQVQGVGFRPFVYRLAQKFGVVGEVYNGIDGVHIFFNASETIAGEFYCALIANAPAISQITSSIILETANQNFSEFKIVNSEYEGKHDVLVTPDFAMCADCRAELISGSSTNRRAGYPFITCNVCGPRYSIIHRLPFDRENTSMVKFEMCGSCKREYGEPVDRRYFSQTNSCSACGIRLSLHSSVNEIPEVDYISK